MHNEQTIQGNKVIKIIVKFLSSGRSLQKEFSVTKESFLDSHDAKSYPNHNQGLLVFSKIC